MTTHGNDYSARSGPFIALSRLTDVVRDMGFDPKEVRSVAIEGKSVTVTTYLLCECHGARYSPDGTRGVATVTTEVEVVDDEREGS